MPEPLCHNAPPRHRRQAWVKGKSPDSSHPAPAPVRTFDSLAARMDQTLRSILRILEEGKPELKIAACQVLGELQPTDGAAARALADRLTNQEAFLTPFVL